MASKRLMSLDASELGTGAIGHCPITIERRLNPSISAPEPSADTAKKHATESSR
jgi:hypothetical protein